MNTSSLPLDSTARPIVPMTEEQKFIFDLKGWLLIPEVLSATEIASITQHLETVRTDPQSLPPHLRHTSAGPAAELLDHPGIVGVLREIIQEDTSPDAYGFRCDHHYLQHRQTGDPGIKPHGGYPTPGPLFKYQCVNQRIYSGLTRVVWELNEVQHGKGGTMLMSGSHKNNFLVPPVHNQHGSWLYETYSCAPGSVLLFSENIAHAGATWSNEKNPRLAVFNCYGSVQTQFHKNPVPTEVIEGLPPKRRSLFRGVWQAGGNDGFHPIPNTTYGPDNRSL